MTACCQKMTLLFKIVSDVCLVSFLIFSLLCPVLLQLLQLQDLHPLPKVILEYRQVSHVLICFIFEICQKLFFSKGFPLLTESAIYNYPYNICWLKRNTV